MSALMTRLLCLTAGPRWVGSKLSHAGQPSESLVVLSLYGPDRETRHVGFSLRLSTPLFFQLPSRPASRPKPTNFLSSVRKHLEFARLVSMEHQPGERVVRFSWETPQGPHALHYEGLSKYPNLILTGPDNLIVSAIRYLNDVERPVLPQAEYHPPPQGPDKPNLWDLDGVALDSLVASIPPEEHVLWLKNALRGADPETIRQLATAPEGMGGRWSQIRERLEQDHWGPLEVTEGPPPTLRLYPSATLPENAQWIEDPLEAAARFHALLDSNETFLTIRRRLEQELRTALKREKRIFEKLKGDRSEAERADQYQWWGELMMAQLHTLPPHSTEAVLEDNVRGTDSVLRIPLDPSLSPLQNAQKFFRKSQKGTRGLTMVEERERQVKGRIEQLKSAERSLPALHTAEEVKAALQTLFGAKAAPKAPPKAREAKVPTPNVLKRRLDKDWELCAGSSAAANEYVTFQLAQPDDIWFHVRDFPGSHVILRRLRRDAILVDTLIFEAALLAASKSKAPKESKVTVSYTEKKFVKRIPGMDPGIVSFSKERSVVVEVPPADPQPKP